MCELMQEGKEKRGVNEQDKRAIFWYQPTHYLIPQLLRTSFFIVCECLRIWASSSHISDVWNKQYTEKTVLKPWLDTLLHAIYQSDVLNNKAIKVLIVSECSYERMQVPG